VEKQLVSTIWTGAQRRTPAKKDLLRSKKKKKRGKEHRGSLGQNARREKNRLEVRGYHSIISIGEKMAG